MGANVPSLTMKQDILVLQMELQKLKIELSDIRKERRNGKHLNHFQGIHNNGFLSIEAAEGSFRERNKGMATLDDTTGSLGKNYIT